MQPSGSGGRRPSLAWLIATFFGVGHFPVASGTAGTLAAMPVYLAGHSLGGGPAVAALAALLTVAGVAASTALETRLGYHDPSEVVVDEVAGFLITMILIPPTVVTCIAGFLLFRVLDVIKPWPASRAEKLPGGWGIMADDVVCGIMGNLLMHAGMLLWR